MSDLPEPRQMPHRIDDVVRRFSFGLVDDKRAVKRHRLWLARHGESFPSYVPSCKQRGIQAKDLATKARLQKNPLIFFTRHLQLTTWNGKRTTE